MAKENCDYCKKEVSDMQEHLWRCHGIYTPPAKKILKEKKKEKNVEEKVEEEQNDSM